MHCPYAPPTRQVSIIQSMAKEKDSARKDASAKSGTEVRTLTFSANDDVVIPKDEEILNVEHDRQMGVTRVTTKRDYDEKRSADERAAREGPPATPTYPQPAGGIEAPAVDPSTSYVWGTLDTTKVQNVEAVKQAGPTIAEQESAGMPQEAKDETEVATELQTDANADSAEPAHSPDHPVDSPSKEEAAAAAQSPASAKVAADNAKDK